MNIQFVTGVYAVLTYLTLHLCKPERTMSKLLKNAVKIVLCLPMRHSSIDVFYVPIGLRKSITRMFKWLSILEKVKPNYTNVFEANIIAKYENRPYNLHATCPADYPSSCVSKRQVMCT